VRQGAYKGLRLDKPAKEVQAERAEKPAKATLSEPLAAMPRRAKSPPAGPSKVMGVAISHPDKPLWPDDGNGEPISKLELAQYFESVGDWIMTHLTSPSVPGATSPVRPSWGGVQQESVLPGRGSSAPHRTGRRPPRRW